MLESFLQQELNLTWLDVYAVLFFACGWASYAMFAGWYGRRVPSLHNSMDRFRREWMVQMIGRDNRMVDVNVMRNTTRSSQFFASTTMLILGALLASMGYVQQAQELVSGLPFTVKASARLLEIKMLVLVLIFAYAFSSFHGAYASLTSPAFWWPRRPSRRRRNRKSMRRTSTASRASRHTRARISITVCVRIILRWRRWAGSCIRG
jgi:uncharacterized membrane protein